MRRVEFAQACRFAEILCGDGFPVALYAWLRGAGPARRLTGCDIFHHLASRAMLDRRRVLVIVESSHTEAALRGWLSARALEALWRIEVAAPRLEGNEQAQLRLVAAARSYMPDILVLTLGAPTSEEFAYRHRHVLPPAWVICVGQAVRIELGLVRRAPRAVRQCGLEWAWRVVQEPARLLPRYARALAWFPVAIAADLLRHGRRPPDPAAFY
jgi:N-acetylglucosaminyldiphosphoundecaprenol N-acetyl-beta-D-mannosaminyltransferase